MTRNKAAPNRHTLFCLMCKVLQTFRTAGVTPSEDACTNVEDALMDWRWPLPNELHLEVVRKWTTENMWILLVKVLSYRLECLLYRALRQRHEACNEEDKAAEAARRQKNDLFEVDTVIQRVLQNGIANWFPLSLTTSVSSILTLNIESALEQGIGPGAGIHAQSSHPDGTGMYARNLGVLGSGEWTLRMFEAVVEQAGLGPNSTARSMPETYSANATDRLRTPQFQISAAEPHDLFDFEVDDL